MIFCRLPNFDPPTKLVVMLPNLPSFLKTTLLLSILLVASYYLANRDSKSPSNYFQGSQNTSAQKESKLPQTYAITNPELTNLPGRWAIAVKDLKSNDTYFHNADQKFPAASIYKLAVMYKTYDSIKKGELSKEDIVTGEKSQLDQTLSGTDQPNQNQNPENISMSVGEALRLMITISDNYTAILLSERLGWQNIDKFLEEQGLAGIDLVQKDAPSATANSVLALLERIYNHTAVDYQASREMQELLFAQTVNDRIPKYLPEGTRVAHKTGELDTLRHDAGIVFGKKSDYVVVFLTETNNTQEATENIALMSKKVFDALEAQE